MRRSNERSGRNGGGGGGGRSGGADVEMKASQLIDLDCNSETVQHLIGSAMVANISAFCS